MLFIITSILKLSTQNQIFWPNELKRMFEYQKKKRERETDCERYFILKHNDEDNKVHWSPTE